eukprot:CAMPEP_0116833306 /NCGR_PEP_ID=MMETSP0418-20121206/6364_1 /TAXON_ID=1158023 /ORGANISM="Astrosyne radiata, Strain 13vi08-1A" /LENGTH=36 /DNA_ID= /DNA_START= /DNA_END= /DNA_ORIENTATION=
MTCSNVSCLELIGGDAGTAGIAHGDGGRCRSIETVR